MYVSLTIVDSKDISVALHKTESCISAMGSLNRLILKCSNEASSEWIRLGAVAALCLTKSTYFSSPVATFN